ncbi:beta-ketoacyl-[acyl-carrier-protein] synthase family protein [Thalassospira sp.]|uniref:beta-ketoacyl-[acyl-carrier-protein] synthase family protein n=1 Tax=Thalassospira sp. TaxID=1912094 RepID=UPI002736A425|nr:beta-ketoacyl-[acyl-carrier-protein] synthase family protein [Thalassospira sp.]MDP2698556.1 beta-ketoacyl-[acyl-carrier-protein] synthase family protein [Thalassospira sp.]
MRTDPVWLSSLGIVSSLGNGLDETRDTMFGDRPADMMARDGFLSDRPVMLGSVTAKLPPLPDHLQRHDTRNNRLLWAAAAQIKTEIAALIAQYGRDRIGIILGTSTSGIEEGTQDYQSLLETGSFPSGFLYSHQEIGSPGDFLRDAFDLGGPVYVISTACSSSAKAFAAGARLIRTGLCDAVLVGGVDSLCRLTVRGFDALQSVALGICNPMSKNRDGINIGEGAALFIMQRAAGDIALLGVGESSDAHHPNAPHPDGKGAAAAMQNALDHAGIMPSDIAYLNLHGTATPLNDGMESRAVRDVLGDNVPSSSTKPMTGHTLGAAGAIEAAILWLSLQDAPNGAPLPRHIWDGVADADIPPLHLVVAHNARLAPMTKCAMMSNSFAFGGSNVSVILGRGWHDGNTPA